MKNKKQDLYDLIVFIVAVLLVVASLVAHATGCAPMPDQKIRQQVLEIAEDYYPSEYEKFESIDFEYIENPPAEHPLSLAAGSPELNRIRIIESNWNGGKVTDILRVIVLLHEYGHIVFGRMDYNKLDRDGCPISLMYNRFDFPTECFINNRHYYLIELPKKRNIFEVIK